MEIGEIISDSVKYPASNWTKIIILAVILLIPIVNFIGLGYVLRIIKATLAGIDDLPDFDEVGDMFIDGLKVFIVGIVYFIPVWIIAAIVGVILSFISPASATYYTGADATAFIFGMIASYAVLFIIALIVGLIEIIGIANMAYYDGELGAAFKFSDILNYIATIGWGKYIGVYILIAIISVVLGFIAMFVGLLLLFVGVFITMPIAGAYIYMFGSRAIAMLFADALAENPV